MGAMIIPVANQKGGVGKTTTSLSLGAALSRLGKRVLVIDLDPHANASIHMAFYPESQEYTVYDVFQAGEKIKWKWDLVIKRGTPAGFDFIAGDIRLGDMEVDLKDAPGKGRILSKALLSLRDEYDFIIIDCPPHMGVLQINALVAADLLIIPIQTDFLALHGLRLIFDTIRMVGRVTARQVRYRALATMYDQRASACRRVLDILNEKLDGRVFKTVIGQDTKFREASGLGGTIFDVAPNSRGAMQYLELANEILSL